MLRNFLLVAIRNLRKNALYSVINIAGLTAGIVSSILILLWVSDELTYDQFIPKSDRLYQVWVNADFDGKINSWRSVPLPTYEAMKTADHRILNSAVADWGGDHLLTVDEKKIRQRGFWVSEEFLEMFGFELLQGDPSVVLDEPSSIVISESLARSLFGDEPALDQVIRVDDESDLKVTGILQDLPGNSSFDFEYLMPWKQRERINEWVVDNQDNWGNYSFQVFVELDHASSHQEAEENIRKMLFEHGETEIPNALFFYPMERWHLYSTFENGVEEGGMMDYVNLFSVIALFILAIACINFMNLSTARSEKRAKEVGIRKSVGSGRTELIIQFMGESLIITLLSFFLAILVVWLILPSFNTMVDKQMQLDITDPWFWLGALILILVTGLVAGSYPAFYLSSFNPVRTLKGVIKSGKRAALPRKMLVVIQFSVAIVLLTGTLVIYQQLNMVQNRYLGYDQENLITVDGNDELWENYEVVRNELLASGAVESITRSNSGVTSVNSNNFVGWPGKPEELRVLFSTITTDYDYTETMGVRMLEGRDFSRDFKSDTAAMIINKAALDVMGLTDPIGTQLDLWGSEYTLIGVVDNVLMESVYREVKPLFMILEDWGGVVTIRLARNQPVRESLDIVAAVMEKHNPAYPFEYSFVDEDYQKKFETIHMTRQLAISFSALAILITCLGLFGLASYTAEQRTKEIGIRKVLGATVGNLVMLMSRDFTWLVIIAFGIATPLAWWGLNNYLERYPLRIDLQWWIFPAAGLLTLLFALMIVTNRARAAAQANPVSSLRSE